MLEHIQSVRHSRNASIPGRRNTTHGVHSLHGQMSHGENVENVPLFHVHLDELFLFS